MDMKAKTPFEPEILAQHLPNTVLDTLAKIARDDVGRSWLEAVGGPLMLQVTNEGVLYTEAWRIAHSHPGLFGFALARIWETASHPGPVDAMHPFLYRTDAQMNGQDQDLVARVNEAGEAFLMALDENHKSYAQQFCQLFSGTSRTRIENLIWLAPNEFSRGVALGSLILSYWREDCERWAA